MKSLLYTAMMKRLRQRQHVLLKNWVLSLSFYMNRQVRVKQLLRRLKNTQMLDSVLCYTLHVILVERRNVETPNDISGVVYISMDEAGAWHIAVAKEMRSSGYDVDMNKVI